MNNVYIYVEVQTEESFVNNILCPYFLNSDIYVRPIVCSTKRTASKKYKGGIVNYGKIKHELPIICKSHPREIARMQAFCSDFGGCNYESKKNSTGRTIKTYYGMPSKRTFRLSMVSDA